MARVLDSQVDWEGIGAYLADRRQRLGLSQKQFSLRSGVCYQADLSQYETGKKHPSLEMLIKLADALGIPRNELCKMLIEHAGEPEKFDLNRGD